MRARISSGRPNLHKRQWQDRALPYMYEAALPGRRYTPRIHPQNTALRCVRLRCACVVLTAAPRPALCADPAIAYYLPRTINSLLQGGDQRRLQWGEEVLLRRDGPLHAFRDFLGTMRAHRLERGAIFWTPKRVSSPICGQQPPPISCLPCWVQGESLAQLGWGHLRRALGSSAPQLEGQ